MLPHRPHVHETHRQRHLCLAGGVALNCVANGELLREGPFDDVWIQPAAGDAGGALGAALLRLASAARRSRARRRPATAERLAARPRVRDDDDRAVPRRARARVYTSFDDDASCASASPTCSPTARSSAGSTAAWSSARARSAPAASSATPRSPTMQSTMNLKIKFRESFRPFAPCVLRERVARVLRDARGRGQPVHAAGRAGARRERRTAPSGADDGAIRHRQAQRAALDIPAVTHVDYSARVQTVDDERNGALLPS